MDRRRITNTEWLRNRIALSAPLDTGAGCEERFETIEIALLEQRLKWLQLRLRLSDKDLTRLISKFPGALSSRSGHKLEETLCFLQNRLELRNEQLRKFVLSYPKILGHGIDHNQSLERKIEWAQRRIQLDDVTQMRTFFFRGKRVLSLFLCLDLETNIKPTLSWLKTRIGPKDGDDEKEAALKNIFLVSPSVLSMKPSTLAPKIDYLQECLGEALATEVITDFPTILTYSLERRLRPRLEDAAEIGMVMDLACMRRIGAYTNEMWAKSIEYQSNRRDLQADRLRDW